MLVAMKNSASNGYYCSSRCYSPIKNKVDMGDTRNLVIASLILTLGIGGAEMTFGSITIGGIGLATLVGVLLNLILPKRK